MWRFPGLRGLALVATLILLAAPGCTGKANSPLSGSPAPGKQDQPAMPGIPGLGAIDGLPVSSQGVRKQGSTIISGTDTVASAGSGNYAVPEQNALAIIPSGEDDLAYAIYRVGEITAGKPVSIEFTVEPAAIIPSGEDDLANFEFWVGLSNYTRYSWEWLGPFGDESEAAGADRGVSMTRKGASVVFSMPLNTEELRERYVTRVNEDGESSFSYIVLTTAPTSAGDPPNGVKVISGDTAVSEEYFTNKPHFVPVYEPFVDNGGAGARHGSSVTKRVSDVGVQMSWDHIPSTGGDDARNESFCYQIRRQAKGSTHVDVVGVRMAADADGASFRDPPFEGYTFPEEVDLPTPNPPLAGTTYTYMIKAWNMDGWPSFTGPTDTPSARMQKVTLPIDPPSYLRTEWLPGAGIQISWTPVDQAVAYKVFYGDINGTRQLGPAKPETTLLHQLSDLTEGEIVYYWVVTVGRHTESIESEEVSGFAPVQTFGENGIVVIDTGEGEMRFLPVPAGEVYLGSTAGEYGRNDTLEEQAVPPPALVNFFYIAETEVTNKVWADFIAAGGYDPANNYFSDIGEAWRFDKGITAPPHWGDETLNSDPVANPDHPVTDISWHEAYAFSNWLQSVWVASSSTFPATIGIPSEPQWEYAAEGPDKYNYWLYPWAERMELDGGIFNNGDDGLDMARANSTRNVAPDVFVAETSPVGWFPLGRSWCGALDMAGNLNEWTSSNLRTPWVPHEPDETAAFVVHGGSFWDTPEWLRTSHRAQRDPDSRGPAGDGGVDGVGLRLIMMPNT